MDLRKLRHAVCLAEEGTFASAARRLNLTQPALSRSIQALEASLGLRLFDRTGSGARATVDGVRVLAQARDLLRQEASLRNEAALLARGEMGRVAFGLGPMLSPALGPALAAVLGGGAQLELRVEIEAIQDLEQLLLDERIEFFVADASRAMAHPELEVEPLRVIGTGFYVRAGHPLSGKIGVTFDDLAGFPLASPALDPQMGGLAGRQTIACGDCAALKQLVVASDAVMIGMSLSVTPEVAAGSMVRLMGEGLAIASSPVGLVRRSTRTLSASARRIASAFDAILASHAL